MLRIANPGSDIDVFVRVFRDSYEHLKDRRDFSLDHITEAMIERSNVTSHGHVGQEALRRSSRRDRSLDALYNQSKMYAELYRALGWMQSSPDSALVLSFTLLGEHVATAHRPKALVQECLLGIAYPNDVITVKGTQAIRLFSAILQAMQRNDGLLSRDEMILGPLTTENDRSRCQLCSEDRRIQRYRRRPKDRNRVFRAKEKRDRITKNTMENYTRFPMAALQWSGWAVKEGGYLRLTEAGAQTIDRIRHSLDVRLAHYRRIPAEMRPAFVRFTFYSMLERAGFVVDDVREQMQRDADRLRSHRRALAGPCLFSPFQQLAAPELAEVFGTKRALLVDGYEIDVVDDPATLPRPRRSAVPFTIDKRRTLRSDDDRDTLAALSAAIARAEGVNAQAVDEFLQPYTEAKQGTFYPLIGGLFRLLGLPCEVSRAGVNSLRADAVIVDAAESIPIEIKSPSEEKEISVKAVRQALENKIVMLSRRTYPTNPDATSLVVGFNPPNDRSEVHELVEDIHRTFGFSIGIVDIRSLVMLALNAAASGHALSLPDLRRLKGLIDVGPAPTA